jgi:hypothetical protein
LNARERGTGAQPPKFDISQLLQRVDDLEHAAAQTAPILAEPKKSFACDLKAPPLALR